LTKATETTTPSGGYEAFTRIMHPPSGNFDVVVTQSAIGGDLPGIPTKLSGSPIYTVYLRVGDIQEWVLAYCLPAAKESRSNPYAVYVGDTAPLSPPYPIVTTAESGARRTRFRGEAEQDSALIPNRIPG
jgi:hypothetical protein